MKRPHRPASFAEAVMEGIQEVKDSLAGGGTLTERKVQVTIRPGGYRARDVRDLRQAMGASQAVFAQFLGTSLNTIRSWEQGSRKPSAMARRFMDEIHREPRRWRQRILQCVQYR